MLKFFRENASKIIWVIVVTFIATMFAGFALFGGGFDFAEEEMARQTRYQTSDVAMIGNLPIDGNRYSLYFSETLQQFFLTNPFQQPTPEYMEAIQYRAYTQALRFTIFLHQANKEEIKISGAQKKQIMNSILLQGQLKNKKELKTMLGERGIDYDLFIEDQYNDAKVQHLLVNWQADITVTDEDVDQLYKEHRVRHLLLKAKANESDEALLDRIQAVREEIDSGLSFDAAVKKYSDNHPTTKEKGGDLGWNKVDTFVPEFEATMLSVPLKQISQPFKTQFGYHILEVTDRRELLRPVDFSYEAARQNLLTKRQNRAVEQFLSDFITKNPIDIKDPTIKAYDAKTKGDFQGAIWAYQAQSSLVPSSPVPHYLLAKLYTILQERDLMKTELEKALVKADLNERAQFPALYILALETYGDDAKKANDITRYLDRLMTLSINDLVALNQIKPILEKRGDKKRLKIVTDEMARIDALIKDAQAQAESDGTPAQESDSDDTQ